MGGGTSKESGAGSKPVHKAGLQFAGKDGYVAEEFTRWSVALAYETVFLRFEQIVDHEKPSERTVVYLQEPLLNPEKVAKDPKYQPPTQWNGEKIPKNVEFIKVFIIDYNPKAPPGTENLFIHSYLVDKMFEDQIDSFLQAEDRKLRFNGNKT